MKKKLFISYSNEDANKLKEFDNDRILILNKRKNIILRIKAERNN